MWNNLSQSRPFLLESSFSLGVLPLPSPTLPRLRVELSCSWMAEGSPQMSEGLSSLSAASDSALVFALWTLQELNVSSANERSLVTKAGV